MLTVSALHRSNVQSLHSTDHMWTVSCTPHITCRQRPTLDISHVDSVCPPQIVCTQYTPYISHVDIVFPPQFVCTQSSLHRLHVGNTCTLQSTHVSSLGGSTGRIADRAAPLLSRSHSTQLINIIAVDKHTKTSSEHAPLGTHLQVILSRNARCGRSSYL